MIGGSKQPPLVQPAHQLLSNPDGVASTPNALALGNTLSGVWMPGFGRIQESHACASGLSQPSDTIRQNCRAIPTCLARVTAASECVSTAPLHTLYILAQTCPRAETGPSRRQVMPRILPTPGIHAPDTAHPSASAVGVLATHAGLDNNWCAGCTRGGCLDPLRPTQPGWTGWEIDRVTVDDHVDTQAGQRGRCWC